MATHVKAGAKPIAVHSIYNTKMKPVVLILVTMLLCSSLVVQGRAHKEAVVHPDGFIDNHHNIPRQNYNSQTGGSGSDAGGDADNGDAN
ncbi:hypothetical protein M8C21_007378 [Ambrosia artemisiifolia]|uniref:Uncharacterized protein n=1 Tax=Ambrosia artemisiifolia TaxID=4212 RepID=A0AAD5BT85_AMBAR|nr:hypothetical protein M8C21_007378 [Ambrosia artemisiifolia]